MSIKNCSEKIIPSANILLISYISIHMFAIFEWYTDALNYGSRVKLI